MDAGVWCPEFPMRSEAFIILAVVELGTNGSPYVPPHGLSPIKRAILPRELSSP